MQLLVYLLVYPILWLVSRLPFTLLYLLSDLFYAIVYYLIGYRKKVVLENLQLAFPEKSKKELLSIRKKFYRHLCDMVLEMIKTLGITETQLKERFTFTNVEVIHELEAKNKSTMTFFPHYASWEWTIALDPLIKSKGHAIYQPVDNKYFDKVVRNIREKFGTRLIATRETPSVVRSNRRYDVLSIYGILSDQSPQMSRARYFTKFMGIEVPVHVGAENLCKSLDLPAVYLKVQKLKRGYYQGTFKVLAENPKEYADYEITELFLRETEKSIREAPEYYFWTHKRWKHRGKKPTRKAMKNTNA